MKNDTTTTMLNFVLAVLVILGVVFALMTMRRTNTLRSMQPQLMVAGQRVQGDAARASALLNEVANYNKTANNPELAEIIKEAQMPPQAPAKK
jgi:hypothetical protein